MYACLRVCIFVCEVCHLAFAVLGVWLPPFSLDQGISGALGPVSVVGDTELLSSRQILSAGSRLLPGPPPGQQLFECDCSEGNGDRQHL